MNEYHERGGVLDAVRPKSHVLNMVWAWGWDRSGPVAHPSGGSSGSVADHGTVDLDEITAAELDSLIDAEEQWARTRGRILPGRIWLCDEEHTVVPRRMARSMCVKARREIA